ncbi:MAG: hypothetical protein RSC93_01525 [Erysipelotrichaceae bacterium]
MILTNLSLANIRIDLPKEELVKLIRIHLGIDHFVGINDNGYLIDIQNTYQTFGGTRMVRVLSGQKATEYEIEAQKVCDFLLKNLEDNLNVKSSFTN